MTSRPDDLSDARGRDELRTHRERFGRATESGAESFYLCRWIPSPYYHPTPWDFVASVLGAIMLVAAITAVVVARVF